MALDYPFITAYMNVRILENVRALREGDDATKCEAMRVLPCFDYPIAIAEAGGIPPLVELLRDGSAEAKGKAALALTVLMENIDNRILVAQAGGIPLFVELLRVSYCKCCAASALFNLARGNVANKVLIAEAGAIPLLVDFLHEGTADAKHWAPKPLRSLAINNDANAVAIAAAVGLEAFVELAQRGSVSVFETPVLDNAGVAAKREAALVVAALLGDCVPDSARGRVPYEIKAAIVSFL